MDNTGFRYLNKKDWRINQKGIPKIFTSSLLPIDWSKVKILLTKVEPGGEFPEHIDNYHHVMYFIKGEGKAILDRKSIEIRPNLLLEIPAGTNHGYKNTGGDDLILITVNIPLD